LEVLRGVLWVVLRFRGLEMFAGETSAGPFAIWGVSLIAAPLVGIILAAAAIVPKAIVAPNFG
jgi:hypothetical protein